CATFGRKQQGETVDALAAGTATPTPDPAKLLSAEEVAAAVREPYEAYQQAIRSGDGQVALEYINIEVLEYYENLRQDALKEWTDGNSNSWGWDLVLLRHQFTRDELETLTAQEIFIKRVIDGDVLTTIGPVAFEELVFEGTTNDVAEAYVESAEPPQLTTEFILEDGVWQIGRSNAVQIAARARLAGLSEYSSDEQYSALQNQIMTELETRFGDNVNDMAFYGPLTPDSPNSAEIEAIARDLWTTYQDAVKAYDGVKAVSLVSSDSLAYYDDLVDLALNADRDTLAAESFFIVSQVLGLRLEWTRTQLEETDGATIFTWYTAESETYPLEINIEQLEFNVVNFNRFRFTSDDLAMQLDIVREDDEWKVDLTGLIDAVTQFFEIEMISAGLTSDSFLELIAEGTTSDLLKYLPVLDGPLE
ncbi:MAG: hypothetical protein M9918_21640, partial [Anaerolineae bacterium]|nr:hypothetical protein [Anaerolineae bacterium]